MRRHPLPGPAALVLVLAAGLAAACTDDDLLEPPAAPQFHVKEDDGTCDPENGDCAFALEDLGTFQHSKNMHLMGFSPHFVPFGTGNFNSDLAFWGRFAYQGTYQGFRIIDISQPDNPVELVNFADCVAGSTRGQQGDVVVWENILVRSWDAPATAGLTCGGIPVPERWEGVHVFDVSSPFNPQVVAAVETRCGSHTATGVPDLANDRLLIYSSSSSDARLCRGIDIIEVPLSDPASASYLGFRRSGHGPTRFHSLHPFPIDAGASGADFGPQFVEPDLAGTLVLADPENACATLVDFPAGAIAFVNADPACSFVDKARNVQAAGGVAMVVFNSEGTGHSRMEGEAEDVTIPSIMVSGSTGESLKTDSRLPAEVILVVAPDGPTTSRFCHDTAVILGDVNLAACAGGDGFSVWSLDPADGGALDAPRFLYSQSIAGVQIGHSAAFTWDGEVLVFGHEPGGGGQPRCQESSADVDRSIHFFQAATGDPLGSFLLPRPQTELENCTWHNFNVVPTPGRYVLVAGNYQSGISVVDFTNPAAAREIAFADPAPLVNPENPGTLVMGGDWSTYWYDGRIYQSDIRRGLLIWSLSEPAVAGAMRLGHLNPQTQEFSMAARSRPTVPRR